MVRVGLFWHSDTHARGGRLSWLAMSISCRTACALEQEDRRGSTVGWEYLETNGISPSSWALLVQSAMVNSSVISSGVRPCRREAKVAKVIMGLGSRRRDLKLLN
eukprot:7152791-Ditylum_brightwellii.AAC.1